MGNIVTRRLRIREWQPSDAPALYDIFQDQEIRQSGICFCSSIEECQRIIKKWTEKNEMKAICRKEDNCLIGLIGLNDMGRYEQYKELEYAIAADYRRNGYGAEAVRGMLDFGFRKLDLSVIAAWVHAANIKSARVLEKCGFTLEGRLRRHGRDRGDTLCYSILSEEFLT